MASVTGYTAAKMEELANANIVDGEIVGDDLILTRRDLSQINAGNVRGPQGETGPAPETLQAIGDVDDTAPTSGDGLFWDGDSWVPSKKTTRQTWAYTLPGDIKVPVGQTDFLPYVPISVPSGQTITLVGYIWYLSSGTSFTFELKHSLLGLSLHQSE
jgi:hypothetical protein